MNKKTIFSTILLIVVVVAVLFFRQKPTALTGESPTGGQHQFSQSISDGTLTIGYEPDSFGLATNKSQILTTSYIPACSDGFDYCFYFRSTDFKDTNFDSAGLRVQKRIDLKDQSSCLTSAPTGYVDLKPDKIRDEQNFSSSVFYNIKDAGAGHYAAGEVYRLFYKTSPLCYEFESKIGESQFANYPAGSIAEFSTINREKVHTALKQMVDSIKLTDGETGLFPSTK